ncbi:hypothetical protein [Actinophytocola sediminis]
MKYVVLGIGALVTARINTFYVPVVGFGDQDTPLATYAPVGTLALALIAWQLWPGRSWRVLLIVGSLCTTPTAVLLFLPEDLGAPTGSAHIVLGAVAVPLLLVGALGAATATWQAGRRTLGAIGFGATLVAFMSAGTVGIHLAFGNHLAVPAVGLVVVVATVVAARTAPVADQPEPRPGWPVTIACAVAAASPLVYHLWESPSAGVGPRIVVGDAAVPTAAELNQQLAQHALVVGSVMLGVSVLAAVIAGVVAGRQVLLAGAVAGLLLGTMFTLVSAVAMEPGELATGGSAILAATALAAGVAVARARAGTVTGIAVLGGVVVALVLLRLTATAGTAEILTPVLLVATAVAAVPVLTSLGATLAPGGTTPLVFAGLATGISAGIDGIMLYFRLTASVDDAAPAEYLPTAGLLAVAVGLAVLAHRTFARAAAPDPMVTA